MVCGELRGVLLPGCRRGEERVRYRLGDSGRAKSVSAVEFERLGTLGEGRRWVGSLRRVMSDGKTMSMGDWLADQVRSTPGDNLSCPQSSMKSYRVGSIDMRFIGGHVERNCYPEGFTV